MLADELLEVVRRPRSRRGRQPVDWVSTAAHVDAGAGLTHRSTLADALVVALVVDLVERVPSARTYARKQVQSGRRLLVDHLAIRVLSEPRLGMAGLDRLREVIEPLGWRRDGHLEGEAPTARSTWSHVDREDGTARWAVTELDVSGCDGAADVLARLDDTATDPLDPTTRDRLARLASDGALPDDEALDLLPALIACFARRHRLPTAHEHDVLRSCDPAVAWLAREGPAVGHVADRVADVAATAEEERISGRPVYPNTWTSTSGAVRLAAHRPAMVHHVDPDARDRPDIDGDIAVDGDREDDRPDDQVARDRAIGSLPGSTIGFLERHVLPDGCLDDSLDVAWSLLGIAHHSPGDAALVQLHRQPVNADPDDAIDDRNEATTARSVSRPAFTFKVRRRHLSERRQAEFDDWIGRWGVALDGPPLDWDALFDRPAGHTRRNGLDIGFGHGESTIVMARADPDLDVIGIEVHDPGVAAVLQAIELEPLRNVRVVHGDVIRFLRRIEASTLDVIRIFYPDPWIKARQRHRRLVREDVVAALADRLRPGGELHLATDIADYAEQMRAVCDGEPRLDGGVIARPPERPVTRFEQRGVDAGRTPVDLRYRRR